MSVSTYHQRHRNILQGWTEFAGQRTCHTLKVQQKKLKLWSKQMGRDPGVELGLSINNVGRSSSERIKSLLLNILQWYNIILYYPELVVCIWNVEKAILPARCSRLQQKYLLWSDTLFWNNLCWLLNSSGRLLAEQVLCLYYGTSNSSIQMNLV